MSISKEVEMIEYIEDLQDLLEIWGNCETLNKEAIQLLKQFERVALDSLWKGQRRSESDYVERFSCKDSNPYVF